MSGYPETAEILTRTVSHVSKPRVVRQLARADELGSIGTELSVWAMAERVAIFVGEDQPQLMATVFCYSKGLSRADFI